MGYYHKYTVHILVESVERLKGYRNIYFARFCTSRPPPRQEDCFANLEANNIHNNKESCGYECVAVTLYYLWDCALACRGPHINTFLSLFD